MEWKMDEVKSEYESIRILAFQFDYHPSDPSK